MFYTLHLIVPFVFIICGLSNPIMLKHNIPGWLNVGVGKLNADDIRGLSENQLKDLRKRAFVAFSLSAILTAAIGTAFILFGYGDSAIVSLVCVVMQFAVGAVFIYPLYRMGSLMKKEIRTQLNL